MHAKGVTCSDCHDPHTQRLRAPGNAVCAQCHAPGKFDAVAHHRHPPGSKGAECAACHMPTTTYMGVDARHDHSFRIPRPDRSVSLGVPNACNSCHTDRPATWAAQALKTWYPQSKPGFQNYAEAFAAGGRSMANELMSIARDREQSGFVRASAVSRLGLRLSPATLPALRGALADPDPLVRATAAAALAGADAAVRAQLLPGLLGDPVCQVRMEAARALAGEPASSLPRSAQLALTRALDEYVAAERFNADRPESRANLGNLYADQGRHEEAEAAYRGALALDPSFVQAALYLADLQRNRGAEDAAERTLREALVRDPRSAPALHALGLSLTRQKRSDEALKAFAQAVALAPDSARFAYVYAVALNDKGRRAQARRELEVALKRTPGDRDLLLTLALFERDAGNRERALAHARELAALEPDIPGLRQLVGELSGSGR